MQAQCFTGVISDNKDPDGMHRVQVTVKGKEEEASEWIPVMTPCAGNDAGWYFLPEVGEEVVVAALDAECRQKAVMGSIWNNNAPPPATNENADGDLNQDGANALHFIKSRSGALFIFDDTEGAEMIQLISSETATRLEFDSANELVAFNSDKDLSLVAEKNILFAAEEIEFKAEKQFNCEGDEIQMAASKEMEIAADQDISIKGSGIALN